jgi:hypothetical protein
MNVNRYIPAKNAGKAIIITEYLVFPYNPKKRGLVGGEADNICP